MQRPTCPRDRALVLLVVFLSSWSALASAACSGDHGIDAPDGSAPPPPPSARVTALRGTITDVTGAPLAGVTVTSAGGIDATSDARGRYDLRAGAGANVVRYEKDGFVGVVKSVDVLGGSPTQLDVTLRPMAAAMPLDATAGGSVTGMRGASLSAPANAFVNASGAPVAGMVSVHLTPLDPSSPAEMSTAPGDFTAEMGAGTRVMLESFGMLDITVRQGDETLQVASGQELEIRIPVASGTTDPDPEIALWSFDETRALWVDEGVATFDAATGTYVARTRHMSTWNCDKPYLATCVCGTVIERGDGPLAGARVVSSGLDYFGTTETTAADDGVFCLAVRKDSQVSIAAYHASGGGTARVIASGSSDTSVPVVRGDPRCVDIGTFEVERDVFTDSNGTSTRCEDVSNPFEDICGRDLWSLFECQMAAGACTTRTDPTGGSTTTYESGARTVTTFDAATRGAVSSYYAPDGTLCATGRLTAGEATDVTFTLTSPDGRSFVLVVPQSATGDMTLTCPDGSMRTITAEQRQAFEACNQSSGTMCTVEGGPPGSCTADSDCASTPDGVCCAIPMAGASYCVPRATCDML